MAVSAASQKDFLGSAKMSTPNSVSALESGAAHPSVDTTKADLSHDARMTPLFEAGSPIKKKTTCESLNSSVLAPKKHREREEPTFTDKFIKKYKQLHLPNDAPFEERLKFDIYKRQAKVDKYNAFLAKQQKKLPPEFIDSTFQHLIKDARRRKDMEERLEEERKNEEMREKQGAKKLTAEESAGIYEEHMKRLRLRDAIVEEKRKMKQHQLDMEIVILKAEEKRAHRDNGDATVVVNRMDADIKARREKLGIAAKKQEEKEEEEMEQMFVPKVNKLPVSGKIHTKNDINKSVFSRMAKDIKLRSVKDMVRSHASEAVSSGLKKRNRSVFKGPDEGTPRFECSHISNKVLKESLKQAIAEINVGGTSSGKGVTMKSTQQSRARDHTPTSKSGGQSKQSGSKDPRHTQHARHASINVDSKEAKIVRKNARSPKAADGGKFVLRAKAEKLIEQLYSNLKGGK